MPDTESTAKPELPVAQALAALPPGAYVVAYSGGRDSSVLLHAMSALAQQRKDLRVRALHVNHGMQTAAADWAQHCAQQGQLWHVGVQLLHATQPAPASNREAWAREQRYSLMAQALRPGEHLLTAHHRQDQAETALLNLLRGSGLAGQAAMPAARPLADTHALLLRPLLGVSVADIAAYAQAHTLRWIEDPSNADDDYDRNYLRNTVFPMLEQRFPAAAVNLARSATLAALAEEPVVDAQLSLLAQQTVLAVGALRALSLPQRNRCLLLWLRRQNLPVPRHRMLDSIWTETLYAASDRNPLVTWPGAELRRYRDGLYAMRPLPEITPQNWPVMGVGDMPWPLGGHLRWSLTQPGIVRTLQDGERVLQNGQRRSIKKLFQEAGLPPWQRQRMPALYLDNELQAAGSIWLAPNAAIVDWKWHE